MLYNVVNFCSIQGRIYITLNRVCLLVLAMTIVNWTELFVAMWIQVLRLRKAFGFCYVGVG